jgi:quercetin dioxygenase-like cupin family protein
MGELRIILRVQKAFCKLSAGIICFVLLCSCSNNQENRNSQPSASPASQKAEINKPGVKCTEDSPERRGAEGCTILTNRPFVGSLTTPVYWHIDRFDSLEAAQKAAGPDGVAAEAHGGVWLMTVETQTEEHHGGRHVAAIGPLTLPAADRYSMRVQSSLLMPGSTSPVHTHPGPEVIYIVDGEQCMEMLEAGRRLGVGQSYVVPGGGVHRGRVMGSGARRALALNLYDAAHSASHDLADPPPLVQCAD